MTAPRASNPANLTEPCPSCGLVHPGCSAHRKTDGKPCTKARMHGSPVCHSHGGAAGQVKRAAARRLALGRAELELAATRATESIGGGRVAIPNMAVAMVETLEEAAWNIAFYRRRVQDLDQLLAGPEGEDILAVLGGGGKEGKEIAAKAPAAIVGRVDPGNWKAERNILLRLYDEERERFMHWAKMCRDAGVEEARIIIIEEHARLFLRVVNSTSAALLALMEGVVRRLFAEGRGEDAAMVVDALRAAWSDEGPRIVQAQFRAVRSTEIPAGDE